MNGFSKRERIEGLIKCQRPPLSSFDIFQRICFDIQVGDAVAEAEGSDTVSITDRYDLAIDALVEVFSDKDLKEYLLLTQIPIVQDMEAFLKVWTEQYRKRVRDLIASKHIPQMDKH